MLNSNYKLRSKQETQSRRIKTEMNENPKKISFYLNKGPLTDNKKIINQSDSNQKKSKSIKTVVSKTGQTMSKLIT